MTKDELLKKYEELVTLYTDKEVKLEAYVQRWLDGNASLSSSAIEQLITTTNNQIEQLKSEAQATISEYQRLKKESLLREQGLMTAKRKVKEQLGISPDEIIITGGVLSSNASDSHLIGREKTLEELEEERQLALAEIRSRVATKQITLAEASKLKSELNLAYGYLEQNQEANSNMHR